MSYGNSLKSILMGLNDAAYSLQSSVSCEEWGDDVGRSYADYANDMVRGTDSLNSYAGAIASAESTIQAMDEGAAKSRLERLAGRLNSL